MAESVLGGRLLATCVEEAQMEVTTLVRSEPTLLPRRLCPPWTAVWRVTGSTGPDLVWLRYWRGPTTPGGIEEAHNHCVEQVRTGTLPEQATGDRRQATEVDDG